MLVRKMLPISEADNCRSDRRVVVWRDKEVRGREYQGDHMFVRWGRHPRYDFSDKGAVCPFRMDHAGKVAFASGHPIPKRGMHVFWVNLHDHGMLHFSLGEDPGDRPVRFGFDDTPGAAFLYIDRKRFCSFQGRDRWMMVPVDTDDWGGPWRKARDLDEFRELVLKPVAEQEVDEMNLIEEGQSYGWSVEEAVPWVKTRDDGRVKHGVDWDEEVGVGCGGTLTEHAEDIEFPREPDLPVYYDSDVCLLDDKRNGLKAYEYMVPEFIVHATVRLGERPSSFYAGDDDGGKPVWTEDRSKSKVFHSIHDAVSAVKRVLGYGGDDGVPISRSYTEMTGWKPPKEKTDGDEETKS